MLSQIPDRVLKLFFDDTEIAILKKFFEKEKILDFDVSEELNIPINEVRKVLQEFNYKGFFDFDKLISEKKEHWYDYVWYIKKADFYTFLYKNLKFLCDELERKINVCSSSISFVCPECKNTYQFAEALEYDFRCPECGVVLEENPVDPKEYKEKLKFYRYWLDKIKRYAKEEEKLDIEEIIRFN